MILSCLYKIVLAQIKYDSLLLFWLDSYYFPDFVRCLAGYKAQGPDMFPAVTLPQCSDMTCPAHLWYLHLASVQYNTVQYSTVQWHEVSCSPLISTSAQLWYLHLAAAQKLRQPEEILTCNLSASEIWARTFCGLHYYNWEIPWSLDLYFPFKFHSF